MTCAPASVDGPWMLAQLPSTRTSAPMRESSGACWKRFSNTVSQIVG